MGRGDPGAVLEVLSRFPVALPPSVPEPAQAPDGVRCPFEGCAPPPTAQVDDRRGGPLQVVSGAAPPSHRLSVALRWTMRSAPTTIPRTTSDVSEKTTESCAI